MFLLDYVRLIKIKAKRPVTFTAGRYRAKNCAPQGWDKCGASFFEREGDARRELRSFDACAARLTTFAFIEVLSV
jgi:hypothetical protein